MARNLVLFNPADNEWCVVCRIGSIEDIPKGIVAFYKTRDAANEAAASLREKISGPINIQIFQYSYAKDETDVMKLLLLDGIDFAIKYVVD